MYDDLKKQVTEITDGFSGVAGVILKVNGDEVFSRNPDRVFLAASIIKLFIYEALIEKIDCGILSYNDKIKKKPEDIVQGFGILRFLDGGLSLTIKDLATLMITLSDNTATNILIDILGIGFISDFIKRKGYENTRFERKMFDDEGRKAGLDNYTTARDAWISLDNLCKNDTALSILKAQLCNSKIPLYFFRKAEVAHKTGDMVEIEHCLADPAIC